MKKYITILLILNLILCGCRSYVNSKNFIIEETSYDEQGNMIGYFYYNSFLGILYRNEEKLYVLLNLEEKKEVYEELSKLGLKNIGIYIKTDIGFYKTTYLLNNSQKIKKYLWISDEKRIEKYFLLDAKIRNLISAKEEYKKVFPVIH